MIEALKLSRRFGAFTAVLELTFQIEKGEVVGLLGPNGAGKTTTMRMLTGYLPPSSGTVRVAGLDILRDSLEARRRIGYLPESVPLYGEHRVEEMLAFQGRLFGMPREALGRRSAEVLERVGLAERARSLIGALSKGMRQRVGLALAILPDPEVLILDEPTSGLDPLQRIEVRGLIREVARERTVLISSHILPEVEAVADRLLILHRGRLAATGTREELVAAQAGSASVRLEAFVRDPAEAARLLSQVPGVQGVRDTGRLGIHQGFDLACSVDVREDVGALAQARGWALRELSYKRPTLEQVFARIALDLDDAEATPERAVAAGPAEAPRGGLLTLAPPPAAPTVLPPGTFAPKRAVYNLNPFERGPAAPRPDDASGPAAKDSGA
jgi:ABC-2 type transport system ATP-binding protein